MFDVSIYVEDDKVLGEFIADSYFFEPSKYDYAFYLYKDDERVDAVWYKKTMRVSFDLKDMTGVFYIKAFVRDIEHGDKRAYSSDKISINA